MPPDDIAQAHVLFLHMIGRVVGSLESSLNSASRSKWWESSTNIGSPAGSVRMTHFLSDASTWRREGSSGQYWKNRRRPGKSICRNRQAGIVEGYFSVESVYWAVVSLSY